MDVYHSAFDGLVELTAPANPVAVTQQRATVNLVQSIAAAVSGVDDVDTYVKDLIIAKAKVSNKITEDLVKKYHSSFMSLFKRTQSHIMDLEHELELFKNPLRKLNTAATFVPEPATIKADFIQYAIEANSLGVALADVMPPDLLAQYGMTTV